MLPIKGSSLLEGYNQCSYHWLVKVQDEVNSLFIEHEPLSVVPHLSEELVKREF